MGGGGWVGLLLMLLFWALVIGLTIWAVRALLRSGGGSSGGPTGGGRETPLEILKRRYANGELSREEYLEMRRELET